MSLVFINKYIKNSLALVLETVRVYSKSRWKGYFKLGYNSTKKKHVSSLTKKIESPESSIASNIANV